ncbi:MAG TPA: protoporphyrinogen oxidase [Aggregatilineales bacterium]|nr:protoporphyrinogen oxidase [Aggregatilineales bacterium]
MANVVIVGGGITGLAAAWELQQQGVAYTLLEGSGRLGGKITTESVDGFVIEGAADSFLTTRNLSAWQLCREIGLGDRLIGTNPEKRAVYVFSKGHLHPFPRGMRLIVPLDAEGLMESPLLSEQGKRRMLDEINIPAVSAATDESLASFIRRRFGEEALEIFGDSLLSGIHAADPEKLSVAAAYPDYPRLERTYGSVIRGTQSSPAPAPNPDGPRSMFMSPRRGMGEMIDTLVGCLTGDVRVGQSVTQIDDRTVLTESGERITAAAIILTTSARVAATAVKRSLPQLADSLSAFTCISSGNVSLGFRLEDIPRPLDGTGFVIPRSEGTRIGACTWSSIKFAGRAPDGFALLRVFVGGFGREDDINLPDDELIKLALTALRNIMGIQAAPVIQRVFRWRDASPQYAVGHLERLEALRSMCPAWLVLAGSPYGGIGIPDCVGQGRLAAQQVSQI